MTKQLALSTLGLTLMLSGVAMAGDGNVLYLRQDSDPGAGNTFQSDQSLGSHTAIGTPSDWATQQGTGNLAELSLMGMCGAPITGCGGTASFRQDNTYPGVSQASISASLSPTGNSASLTLSDAGFGTITQVGYGNQANLTVAGEASGSISQTGISNVGNLSVTGVAGSSVSLVQHGAGLNYGGGTTPPPPITVMTNTSVTITQHN